ncbi:tetratricopeptide repeat protein [Eisenbergiella sp.]
MVIAEALKLGSHHFSFEDDFTEPTVPDNAIPEQGQEAVAETVPEKYESDEVATARGRNSGQKWWSREYKLARQYLYGSEEAVQDFSKAYRLFLQEAETGNALATQDIGRMFADGLDRGIDMEKAQEWYAKALAAFLAEERHAQERQRPYLQYRIGKMYLAGLGTGQDYEAAAKWFSKAVSANHKYAQYSLAGLYYRGQGVAQDYEHAFRLYKCSAEQGNPYAEYELAKMYRDGIGTKKNQETAEEHFTNAFSGFTSMESRSHDDKLQYRLGQMLHTGTGTP